VKLAGAVPAKDLQRLGAQDRGGRRVAAARRPRRGHRAPPGSGPPSAWAAGTFTVNGWISGVAGNTMRTDVGDTWTITLTEIV